MVGVTGSRELTMTILSLIDKFLQPSLKMNLSPEKTLVTHFPWGKVRFLGYFIEIGKGSMTCTNKNSGTKRRTLGWQPRLFAPSGELVQKLKENNFCTSQGRGICKKGWIKYPDEIIVM